MLNSASITLILLLACSALSAPSLGLAISSPMTTSAFGCLAIDVPNPFCIVRAYKVSGTPGIDPNAVQTLKNCLAYNNAVYGTLVYVEICRGQNATNQVLSVLNEVDPYLYNFVYIKVVPNQTPGCSWEGYSYTDNCNYLTEAINAINANAPQGVLPGVFSTARLWAQYFANECDSIGQMSPQVWLWYANYEGNGKVNSALSMDDFIPFGGWTPQLRVPYMKQVSGNTTVKLCNNPDWHANIDQVFSAW